MQAACPGPWRKDFLKNLYAGVALKMKTKIEAPEAEATLMLLGRTSEWRNGEWRETREKHIGRWKCVRGNGMDIRNGPYFERRDIVGFLKAYEIFDVDEQRPVKDGGFFLRLSDSRSWVFSESRSGTF